MPGKGGPYESARRARTALATTVAAGAGLAGVLGMGGVAHAATHSVNGFMVIDSCTASRARSPTPGTRADRQVTRTTARAFREWEGPAAFAYPAKSVLGVRIPVV
jgi:hypothetical protein